MSTINHSTRPLPDGVRRFKEKKAMMAALEEQGFGVPIPFDLPTGRATVFFLYPSLEVFINDLRSLPQEHWNAYEIIRQGMPCLAHADIDYKTTASDPDHTRILKVLRDTAKMIQSTYGITPVFKLLCATRLRDGLIKHSYHPLIANLAFSSNKDPRLKTLFGGSGSHWWYHKGDERKSIVDDRIYSNDRNMRFPFNSKMGDFGPLIPLHVDLEAGRIEPLQLDDPLSYLADYLISNPVLDEKILYIQSEPERPFPSASTGAPKVAKGDAQAKEGRAPKRQRAVDYLALPCPLSVLKEMLEEAGDHQSVPTGSTYIEHEQKWKVQCDAKKQLRDCLVSPKQHDGNNYNLFVTRHQGGLKVELFCMGEPCRSMPKPTLGYIHFNPTLVDWGFVLSPQFVRAPISAPEEPEQQMEIDEPQPGPVDLDVPCVEDEQGNPEPPVPSVQTPIIDLENPYLNRYDEVKARFEPKCFKIRTPFAYGVIEKTGLSILSHVAVQQYFCDWVFWERVDDKDHKMDFMSRWLRDPNKRCVDSVTVDPTGKMKDIYNLWAGFTAETIPAVPEEDEDELIAPIVKHINDVITGGNADHTKWVMDYIANMIQRPERKSQVAISLYGAQGCGKGIIFEFLRQKVLGEQCSFQTSKPEIDMLGRFANGALNRVCVQVDEVKSLHDFADRLKDLITNQTLNYEQKGKDTIVVPNLSNIILTSNNANALTVSADDRRYVLFHCSSVYKGDPAYFNALGSHLDRPEVARAFYQHCLKRDLSPYPKSFQFTRPITDYYREAQRNSIPVLSRFISGLINGVCPESIASRDLYRRYVTYHADGNYKFLATETAFARDIKKINGISRKKTNSANLYQFKADEIKKYLADLNEYDPDAEIA